MRRRNPSDHPGRGQGRYLLLYAKALSSSVFADPALWHLFSGLLMMAKLEQRPTGRERKIPWGRGERKLMPGEFTINYRDKAMLRLFQCSKSTLHRRMRKLEHLGQIGLENDVRPGQPFTLVTICNWDDYQPWWDSERDEAGTAFNRSNEKSGTESGTGQKGGKAKGKKKISTSQDTGSGTGRGTRAGHGRDILRETRESYKSARPREGKPPGLARLLDELAESERVAEARAGVRRDDQGRPLDAPHEPGEETDHELDP